MPQSPHRKPAFFTAAPCHHSQVGTSRLSKRDQYLQNACINPTASHMQSTLPLELISPVWHWSPSGHRIHLELQLCHGITRALTTLPLVCKVSTVPLKIIPWWHRGDWNAATLSMGQGPEPSYTLGKNREAQDPWRRRVSIPLPLTWKVSALPPQ